MDLHFGDYDVNKVRSKLRLLGKWVKDDLFEAPIPSLDDKHGYVYILRCPYTRLVKIGKTRNPRKRILKLNEGRSFDYWLMKIVRHDKYESLEKRLHDTYESYRQRYEWFSLSDDLLEEMFSFLGKYEDVFHMMGPDIKAIGMDESEFVYYYTGPSIDSFLEARNWKNIWAPPNDNHSTD